MAAPPASAVRALAQPVYFPGRIYPLAVTNVSGGANLTTQACSLMGWSIQNTSTSALAAFEIFDGINANDLLTDPVTLYDNESTREWFGPQGIELKIGLFFVVTTGAVSGSVRVSFRKPGP